MLKTNTITIGSVNVFNDAERYNPSTNKWTSIAPMTKHRSYLAATTLKGHVYANGGQSMRTIVSLCI